ncbi:hypothetical protein [Actinomadura rudentiformis]|uniref:hypothetical protein n=1 Tax=Actinomadura rudentiformis TaxID=359158 RepID=UPI00178C809B|nr:hypothetical protein [Actinomadura rudentiformis]
MRPRTAGRPVRVGDTAAGAQSTMRARTATWHATRSAARHATRCAAWPADRHATRSAGCGAWSSGDGRPEGIARRAEAAGTARRGAGARTGLPVAGSEPVGGPVIGRAEDRR